MESVVNEQELVAKAKSDEAAFRQLYDFYFPKIYGYIKKRVTHTETAQDLVSEVFMKAFVNIGNFEFKGAPFSSWLYKIAANIVIDHYRKSGHYKTVDIENFQDIESGLSADLEVNWQEDRNEVNKYLAVLPDRERQVIELKFFAEQGNLEIAQSLGISANLVGVIIYRALTKMKKLT